MSDMAITASATDAHVRARGQRSAFYFYMPALLVSIVVVGFAPTLFLRGAFFDVPPIPLYLFVHGFVLTGWFVWLLVQTSLARTGRIAVHRTIGVIGAFYALAVLAGALMATLGSVHRVILDGFDLGMDVSAFGENGLGSGITIEAFMSGVVFANVASAVSFAALVGTAVLLRSRPDSHKRLMLLASISILGPALARISRWPVLGGEQGPFVPLALVLLLLAVLAHDVVSRRRIHPATLFGAAVGVATSVGGSLIATTHLGRAFVRWLA
jgi:hypothetical protein